MENKIASRSVPCLVQGSSEYQEKINEYVLEKLGDDEFARFKEYEKTMIEHADHQRYLEMATLQRNHPGFKEARDEATAFLKKNYAILRGR